MSDFQLAKDGEEVQEESGCGYKKATRTWLRDFSVV